MSVREYQRQMPLGGGLGTKLSARLHLDAPLLTALLLLVLGGLAVLYSAGGGDLRGASDGDWPCNLSSPFAAE